MKFSAAGWLKLPDRVFVKVLNAIVRVDDPVCDVRGEEFVLKSREPCRDKGQNNRAGKLPFLPERTTQRRTTSTIFRRNRLFNYRLPGGGGAYAGQ